MTWADEGMPEIVGCTAEPPGTAEGRWLPGEIVAVENDPRVPLFAAPPELSRPGPGSGDSRTLVSEGWALVRITDLDWTDRRGRLEILLLRELADRQLEALLSRVLEIASLDLDLRRVHGLLTPGGPDLAPVLTCAGFSREVVIPDGIRVGGRPCPQEIWGHVTDDAEA